MRKQKMGKPAFYTVWLVCLALLMICLYARHQKKGPLLSEEAFTSQAEVTDEESVTRALVWLKHTVHSPDGIYYRYVVETDCESWDFESRYVTDAPIPWVADETSAAEVLVHTVEVSLNGSLYASGTYYTVPILGDLSSEEIPLDDWKESLIKSAYEAYRSGRQARDPLILALPVMGAILAVFAVHTKKKVPE